MHKRRHIIMCFALLTLVACQSTRQASPPETPAASTSAPSVEPPRVNPPRVNPPQKIAVDVAPENANAKYGSGLNALSGLLGIMGKPKKAELIAMLTQLYSPSELQSDRYGHYVYLVFTNNEPATLNKRLAATSAFLCRFTQSSGKDVAHIAKRSIALFQAPMQDDRSAADILEYNDLYGFQQHYSYVEGQLLARLVEHQTPISDIGIVTAEIPIGSRYQRAASIEYNALDLSQFSAHEIHETIVSLRKYIVNRPKDPEGTIAAINLTGLQTPLLSMRLASFFESVGQGFIALTTFNQAMADERGCD
ncbi:hypothetical protein [Alteromonas oceanisediminis]|uniref:hypothetical protein n=1 Tax=Alteromonas oceanisediminis TaxID=2836180 RepID=UPI001BD9F739|nr:hypothetical protein [Alteromonas oceanisediminis]MBT0587604.1 hypothetical protein [Alteromonas oceanisediminis]